MGMIICWDANLGKRPDKARVRKLICIDIPVIWPPRWPGPDPYRIRIDGKEPIWGPDAQALAAIREMIPTVSRKFAGELKAISARMLLNLQADLPDGAKASFTPPAQGRRRVSRR